MDKQINIVELLDWYMWTGVEETCGVEPCLWNESKKDTTPPYATNQKEIVKNTISQPQINKTPAVNFSAISKNARDICNNASCLEELREIMQNFEGCHLKKTAANTVFGDGNPHAKIVLIGEAPGADEDRIGKPFVGRCGKLLDKMFEAINIKREDCYITNVLPWRPPGNRTPTDEEIAICLPFLKRQLELICPQYILLLGGISLKSLLEVETSISRSRGQWFEYEIMDNKKAMALATYHPSYLLRSTAQKAKVWSDLLLLQKKIEE